METLCMPAILYRPVDGVAADVIPFYWNGKYHLFFLKDFRDPAEHGEGTPWWHLVTRDFVHFEDLGEALPCGLSGSQDRWVFTGSVIERNGVFHIFYTGHNHHLREEGRPIQAVMHAVSPDLHTWVKDEDFILFAPTERGFEQDDWRDPFVFYDEETGQCLMLLAARKTHGPGRNRGCIALAASDDLHTWDVGAPFWEPDEYYTHECPDLFRIGGWWYLVYSTFSERTVTHYRMSRSLRGPWLAPANDTFDGRAFYAAKTAGHGRKRFLFGWLPTREMERDDGGWQWGGDLVVHEIVQQIDGTLAARMPDTIRMAFINPEIPRPAPVLGEWQITEERIRADAVGRHSVLLLGALPDECLVTATICFDQYPCGCGLLLRADADLEHYYQLRLEPANRRMVIDRWPRPGDQPFMLERPLHVPTHKPVSLRLLVSGTNLVVYANDTTALSCRLYDHRAGQLGLFVTEGLATFRDVQVLTR